MLVLATAAVGFLAGAWCADRASKRPVVRVAVIVAVTVALTATMVWVQRAV